MIYRKAGEKDIKEFHNLFSKCLPQFFGMEYPPRTIEFMHKDDFSKENCLKGVKSKRKTIFIALENDKIIGFLIISRPYGGVSFADWLAVDEKYHHKGVASNLIKLWEKEAISIGCHKLHLWTEERNLQFYKNRGFVLVGKIPKNYFGADDYLFYKSLQEPKEENYLRDYLNHTRLLL